MHNHTREEATIREGIRRRNSSIRIKPGPTGPVIDKTYHARFTARQEYEAYVRLDELLMATRGVRRPIIHAVDENSNTIRLEYVDGPNLMDDFLQRGVSAFEKQREVLIPFFAAARGLGVRFDSDPANFLLAHDQNELVLVDPVCEDVDLPDFTIVVFLWGMIKSFIRSKDWRRMRSLAQSWKRYYVAYLRATGVNSELLNGQMSRYIDLVIAWNLTESQGEAYWKRAVRKLAVVPVWRTIELPFRWNLIKGCQSDL